MPGVRSVREHAVVRTATLNLLRAPWERDLPADLRRPTGRSLRRRPPGIPLYWSRSGRATNFGDELTWLILRRITGLDVRWTPLSGSCLVGAGSVLEWLARTPSRRSDTRRLVWGAGAMHGGGPLDLRGVDVLGLRGHLTLERLSPALRRDVRSLGDPALLVSEAFPAVEDAASRSASGEVVLVPHYADLRDPFIAQMAARYPAVRILDPRGDPLEMCRRIAAAAFVLSSGAHPLIVADSFEVPNARIRISDRVLGGDYKFLDHYSVFGVRPEPLSTDVVLGNLAEAVAEGRADYDRPGLADVTKGLRRSLDEALVRVGWALRS